MYWKLTQNNAINSNKDLFFSFNIAIWRPHKFLLINLFVRLPENYMQKQEALLSVYFGFINSCNQIFLAKWHKTWRPGSSLESNGGVSQLRWLLDWWQTTPPPPSPTPFALYSPLVHLFGYYIHVNVLCPCSLLILFYFFLLLSCLYTSISSFLLL